MLNIDKYREEILEAIEEQKRIIDINDPFYWHKIYFYPLKKVVKKYGGEFPNLFSGHVIWLLSEYKPPLLKNGDDLKPGDWIMVRDFDDQDWHKAQFMCYYNNEFCVAYAGLPMDETHIFTSWSQARLPEEKE